MEDDVDEMHDTALKLEAAEIKLIQKANKAHNRDDNGKHHSDSASSGEASAARHIGPDMRPTHRLKPLIGEKVDTIQHCRKNLAELLEKVQNERKSHLAGKEELVCALFIEFDTMASAQYAFALTVDEKPGSFVARQMGILPDEVVWKSLKMNAWDRSLRRILATAAISALILFWSIPVALVGIISNVNYLTENVPFLAWIDSIPSVILGVVTGLLPTILLAALMALVPVICRGM
jgi:hypothetical protein